MLDAVARVMDGTGFNRATGSSAIARPESSEALLSNEPSWRDDQKDAKELIKIERLNGGGRLPQDDLCIDARCGCGKHRFYNLKCCRPTGSIHRIVT
jgi:hypothetical protein